MNMLRTWCNQIRFNKPREYIPRGFRLLNDVGIKEWNGSEWVVREADQVAILSVAKVRSIVNKS